MTPLKIFVAGLLIGSFVGWALTTFVVLTREPKRPWKGKR